jgi:hypothetical protein
MAAPSLKHYRMVNAAGANSLNDVTGAVPAARALVVSKISFANLAGVSQNISFYIGTSATHVPADIVVNTLPLGPGQQYTETNLVVLAGERLYFKTDAAATNSIAVSVFGEEVDN